MVPLSPSGCQISRPPRTADDPRTSPKGLARGRYRRARGCRPCVCGGGVRAQGQGTVAHLGWWWGGGGGRHDTWVCCCLQLAAPIGRLPLTAALPLNPLPPEAAVPIVPSLSLPYLPYSPLPVPWEIVPMEPPDCPCFSAPCRVHTAEGNGPCHWRGALKNLKHKPSWHRRGRSKNLAVSLKHRKGRRGGVQGPRL